MISKGKTDQVTINLDGKDVEVPVDMNLVDAVALHGKEIPHYCYHPSSAWQAIAGCASSKWDADEGRSTGEPILKRTVRLKSVGSQAVIGCGTNVLSGYAVKTESEMVTGCRRA